METREENNSEKIKVREAIKPPKKRGWPFWFVFIVSAWMFFLGVIVGRGTSPVSFDIHELEKKIASLRKSALEAEELSVEKASPVSPDVKSELEFYEVLKMPGQTDPIDKAKPTLQASLTPEPPVKTKTEPPVKSQSVTKPDKSQVPKKSEVKTIPKVSEPAKTTEKADKHYSIQVASLKDPSEADRLVETFRRKGYPAYRASAEVRNSGTWHRVRIGPFIQQSEALRVLGPVSRESTGALIIEHSP